MRRRRRRSRQGWITEGRKIRDAIEPDEVTIYFISWNEANLRFETTTPFLGWRKGQRPRDLSPPGIRPVPVSTSPTGNDPRGFCPAFGESTAPSPQPLSSRLGDAAAPRSLSQGFSSSCPGCGNRTDRQVRAIFLSGKCIPPSSRDHGYLPPFHKP